MDIANYGQVFSGNRLMLCRGAQPTLAAILELKAAGVATVLNLRNDPLFMEQWAVEQAGMKYWNFPLHGLAAPENEQIDLILAAIARSPASVFIHCLHGEDRTGTVIACYRMKVQGWTNDQAMNEAKGFHINPMQFWMKEFIRDYKGGSKQ